MPDQPQPKEQNHKVVFYMIGAVILFVVLAAFWAHKQKIAMPKIDIGIVDVDDASSTSASTEPPEQVMNIEDALLSSDPVMVALAKEMKGRIFERIGQEKKYLVTCLSGLKQRKTSRFVWDSVLDMHGDGMAITIRDHYSKNWPVDFSEKEQACWNGIFIDYSFPSKMQGSLLFSVPLGWPISE